MQIQTKASLSVFLSGKKLYGDDFNEDEIMQWYKDEEEGYANLGSKNKEKYAYQYTAMDQLYGFSYIDDNRKFKNALGLGSAYGHEFLPIINQIDCLTIVEPSEQLRSKMLGNVEPIYVKPNVFGNLNFPDNSFDLIVSFSVLHHIPNVSFVLSELFRVLSPNGVLLIREPIVSMGDWSKPRKGLTKNERGIPLSFFEKIIEEQHIQVVAKNYCDCSFLHKMLSKLFKLKFNSKAVQSVDRFFSIMLSWNHRYHRLSLIQKIAPSSIFFVLKK
jgi:SAM-dependent methyltransferase